MSQLETVQFERLRGRPTINQFAKTIEGQDLIMTGKIFALNGVAYHGFQGHVVTADPRLLSDKEIEELIDLDGESRQQVIRVKMGRLEARDQMKREELEERAKKRRAEKRDELELRKLEREEAALLEAGESVKTPADLIAEHKAAIARLEESKFVCDECGEGFPSNAVLQGHIVGKHKPKRKPKS